MRWVLLALAATACLPTVDFSAPTTCEVPDAGLSTPSGRAALIDEPITVVSSRKAPRCPPPLQPSVQVTVSNAAGLAVPVEAAGPFARGQYVTVELTFTPRTPGVHQVDAIFEPELGRATSQVLAVETPSLGQALGAVNGAIDCLADAVTPAGTWLCLGPDSHVSFWRQGGLVQRVPAASVEVRGHVVWLFAPNAVERFVDRGASVLPREPDVVLVPGGELGGARLRAIDDGALLAVAGEVLQVLTIGPAGLERAAPVNVPRGVCGGPLEVVPRGREHFSVACESRPGWIRFCDVPASAPAAARCGEWRGRLVGVWASGLWLIDGAQLAFHTLDATATLELPAGWTVSSSRRLAGAFSPVVSDAPGRTFVVQIAGDAVVLRALPDGLTLIGLDETRLLLSGLATRSIRVR
jgi:hypothetical protein